MLGVKVPVFGLAADSVVFATVSFTNTISTGVIILTAIAAAATVVGVIYGIRYKTSYLTEKATREALDDRVRGLAHERDDYKAKLEEATKTITEANRTIARLEPLKDIGRVLEMITDTFDRLVTRQEVMHVEWKLKTDQQTQILLDEMRHGRTE
jgi:hypothetical protein